MNTFTKLMAKSGIVLLCLFLISIILLIVLPHSFTSQFITIDLQTLDGSKPLIKFNK